MLYKFHDHMCIWYVVGVIFIFTSTILYSTYMDQQTDLGTKTNLLTITHSCHSRKIVSGGLGNTITFSEATTIKLFK